MRARRASSTDVRCDIWARRPSLDDKALVLSRTACCTRRFELLVEAERDTRLSVGPLAVGPSMKLAHLDCCVRRAAAALGWA